MVRTRSMDAQRRESDVEAEDGNKNAHSQMRRSSSDINSEPYSVSSQDLVDGIAEFYNNPALSDGELLVDGRVFPIHRNILAAVSPYFRAMYMGNFKESKSQSTRIEGVCSEVVEILLEAVYKKTLRLNIRNVTEVLTGAHMMQIGPVLEQCEKFMQKNMNPEICLEYMKLTEMYNLSQDVLDSAVHSLLTNFKMVSQDEAFLDLPADALVDYFNSDLLYCKEIDIFNSVMKWIAHSPERKFFLKDLFQVIRLGLIDTEDLMGKIACHPLIVASEFCQKLVRKATLYKSNLYAQPLCGEAFARSRGSDMQVFTREFRFNPALEDLSSTLHMREEENFLFVFYNHEAKKSSFKTSVKIPFARHSLLLLVNKHKNFFFAHGVDSRSCSNTMCRFNCGTHNWTQLVGMPQDATVHYSIVLIGNKLLLVGGYTINRESKLSDSAASITPRMSHTVWQYDIAQNNWEKRNDFPHKIYNMGACMHEDELYVFGGCIGNDEATNKVYKYNQEQDIWVRKASMNFATMFPYRAYAEIPEGFVVVSETPGRLTISDLYTCATDQWTTVRVPVSNIMTRVPTAIFIGHYKESLFLYTSRRLKPLLLCRDKLVWEESQSPLIPTGTSYALVSTCKPHDYEKRG